MSPRSSPLLYKRRDGRVAGGHVLRAMIELGGFRPAGRKAPTRPPAFVEDRHFVNVFAQSPGTHCADWTPAYNAYVKPMSRFANDQLFCPSCPSLGLGCAHQR